MARRVVASRVVTDLVAGSGVRFAPRGPREVKGSPGTCDLYARALRRLTESLVRSRNGRTEVRVVKPNAEGRLWNRGLPRGVAWVRGWVNFKWKNLCLLGQISVEINKMSISTEI